MDMKHYFCSFFIAFIKKTFEQINNRVIDIVFCVAAVCDYKPMNYSKEKIKKQIRDGNEINQLELVKELGDVLFYVTALANHIGSDLQTVATNNIAKLHDRQKRNKLQGSGDNR